jgi:hypothetical protein
MGESAVRHRIGMAIVCLHISAALYLALPFLMAFAFSFADDEEINAVAMCLFLLAFCLPWAIGMEVIVYGLKRRKFWAWVAGLIVFSMYAMSIFLPLGAFGLWGLLDRGSRAEFGMHERADGGTS